MHPNSIFQDGYDFLALAEEESALKPLLFKNDFDKWTIDFSIKKNVRLFNQALMKKHFGIENWHIPDENLCPTLPGRADYLYYLKDIIGDGKRRILDIGTGASIVYPIVGNRLFSWSFVGSEISTKSISNAKNILEGNNISQQEIEIRQQTVKRNFFKNIVLENDHFDACICNPPFFESEEQARSWNWKKWKSEKSKSVGTLSELVVKGGEKKFISDMIKESMHYKKQFRLFTTLVSKQSSIPFIEKACKSAQVTSLEFVEMKTGRKVSRIAVWRFS